MVEGSNFARMPRSRHFSLRRCAAVVPFLAILLLALGSNPAHAQAIPAACPNDLGTANIIDHDFSVSFCELCEIGTVRLEIENPYRNADDADFSDLVVTENLLQTGLTYVPNSTRFFGNNIAPPPIVQPNVGGPNGSVLTWTIPSQFVLESRSNGGGGGSIRRLIIEFDVRRNNDPEGLVAANKTIEGQVEFTPSFDLNYRHTSTTGPGLLPFNAP